METSPRGRTSALLIRVWTEGGRGGGEQVIIRIAARADVESGEQQTAVFSDVASAGDWIGRWLSEIVTGFPDLAGRVTAP